MKSPDAPTTHSITTEQMTSEKVEPDTFKPPHHKLKHHIETRFTALLKEYDSQIAQNETSIWTTPLTEMTKDTGTSKLLAQKSCPIAMKHYQWVKDEINKLLTAKTIWGIQSSWSAPIIVVPKGHGGKYLVTDYCTLNKVTEEFIWHLPKEKDIFSPLNEAKDFSTLDLWAEYHDIPLDESSITKTEFTSPFRKYEYIYSTFWTHTTISLLPENHDRCLKGFLLHHCLSRWHDYLQQNGRRTP